jgi:hypothetical protein
LELGHPRKVKQAALDDRTLDFIYCPTPRFVFPAVRQGQEQSKFRTTVFAARAFAVRGFPDLLSQTPDLWVGVRKRNVFGKGVFGRNGLADSVRHDGIVVNTAGELI